MGQMLVREVLDGDGLTLAGGTGRVGSASIGRDLGILAGRGAIGREVSCDPSSLFETAEAVIDFTTPEATLRHVDLAARQGCAMVIGTTGLAAAQEQAIARAAGHVPIVLTANMIVGVNLLLALVEQAAATLADDTDIEIVEMHHRHKVDAPSGTALALGKAAAIGRAVNLDAVAQKVRDGLIGPRQRGDIGFATLRGGDVVGDHQVIFAAEGERLILGHQASSRQSFAKGAVRAARWTRGRAPGLYSMRDVLDL
jgi:4-hydroxy-tetrahydrodipicolinate reductase